MSLLCFLQPYWGNVLSGLRFTFCATSMPPVRFVRIPVQVVLTANENEDYLIKILLRQTRRPEVNITLQQCYESDDAAATLDR